MNQQQIAQNKLQEHDGGRTLHGSWKHVQVVQLVILHSPWSCAWLAIGFSLNARGSPFAKLWAVQTLQICGIWAVLWSASCSSRRDHQRLSRTLAAIAGSSFERRFLAETSIQTSGAQGTHRPRRRCRTFRQLRSFTTQCLSEQWCWAAPPYIADIKMGLSAASSRLQKQDKLGWQLIWLVPPQQVGSLTCIEVVHFSRRWLREKHVQCKSCFTFEAVGAFGRCWELCRSMWPFSCTTTLAKSQDTNPAMVGSGWPPVATVDSKSRKRQSCEANSFRPFAVFGRWFPCLWRFCQWLVFCWFKTAMDRSEPNALTKRRVAAAVVWSKWLCKENLWKASMAKPTQSQPLERHTENCWARCTASHVCELLCPRSRCSYHSALGQRLTAHHSSCTRGST